MAGSSAGPIWLHHPVAAVQDQLQVERALELAANWDLCSQHAWMSGGLHCGSEPLQCVLLREHANQTDKIEGRGRLAQTSKACLIPRQAVRIHGSTMTE